MDRTVKAFVNACLSCQKAKVARHDIRPWQQFELPGARFDHVHVDFVGPLPMARGGIQYLFTIIDRYSRYPVVVPVTTTSARVAIKAFTERWMALFGIPLTLTSDQGPAFRSTEFNNFLSRHNIRWQPATTYHPQANGLVERLHRRLKEALTAAGGHWTDELPWIMLSIRNAKGQDIGYSPNEALYGANTRMPQSATVLQDPVPVEKFVAARCAHQIPAPAPGRWHRKSPQAKNTDLSNVEYVLIKRHQKRPLQYTYAGPFPLVKYSDKTVTVTYQGKPLVVTRDRIKAVRAYDSKFFFAPEDDNNLLSLFLQGGRYSDDGRH